MRRPAMEGVAVAHQLEALRPGPQALCAAAIGVPTAPVVASSARPA
ncbi:hypothetical protein [Streptomyces sp. NPDC060027]